MSLGFAKKVGMTRIFLEGKSTPVTVLQFEKNYILQLKTLEKDGYKSVQVAGVKKKNSTKPELGHVKKYLSQELSFQKLAEFRNINLPEDKKYFDINDFSDTDLLDITGVSIGKGFTGVVKRWGFHGQPASHGHDHERAPGSIGSRWPQRVPAGKKMAGHMGNKQVTLKKAKVVAIDKENSLIFVKGSIPGSNTSYLKIQKVK